MTVVLLKAKDGASGQLDAGISAAALTIPLKAGEGAEFPQPETGTCSSTGSNTVLNDTGDLGDLAVDDFVRNVTDGSWAFVVTAGANSITTTQLQGGSDNTWTSGDTWRANEFVATLAAIDADGNDTASEEILISNRSTDNLTVPSGGRGYNGTVAQGFNADDYVQLRVTSPYYEELKKLLKEFKQVTDSTQAELDVLEADLVSDANGDGASMIGVEDAGGYYASSDVESVLQAIGASLASTVQISQIGWFGDGSDGSPSWTSGASLNPATEKRYTTATLPVSQTLTVSSVNVPLIIHATGNVTINGTIDLNSKGGAAGAAGSSAGNGGNATAGFFVASGFTNGAGNGGTHAGSTGGGGGGGASGLNSGSAGTNAGAGSGTAGSAGTKLDASKLALLSNLLRGIGCGGGGGGGGGGSSNAGGAGGAGGGAMVMLIGGSLTLGASSIIRANGANGSNAAGSNGGGGGGGAGGMILIIVAGAITNSGVTVSASGSTGGSPDNNGGTGGSGGTGQVLIYSLSTGTLIAS